MKVSEIMNRRPVTVAPDTPLRDVVRLMLRFHLNDVLVQEREGHLIGIITYKDIFQRLLPEYGEIMANGDVLPDADAIEDRLIDATNSPAEDIMTKRLHTATPDTDAFRAAALMNAQKVKQLPVVDNGRLVGIVSYKDITWALMAKYHKYL